MTINANSNMLPFAMPNTIGPDDLEITVIHSPDPLTKSYGVGPDGRPCKGAEPFLSRGEAHRITIDPTAFAPDFGDLLTSLDENLCIVLGAMADTVQSDVADITTRERYEPRALGAGNPLIWRGKAWLNYGAGKPAIVGLDHDAKDLPPDIRRRLHDGGGLLAVLESVCPVLMDVARVTRASVSTGIVVTQTGEVTTGGGLHVYLAVRDGADAKDFVARLHDRLVLDGWGFPFVSEAGGVFVRSLIDTAASGIGERLWFEAPGSLEAGLAHISGARDPVVQSGPFLDTRAAFEPLTNAQAVKLSSIQMDLRATVAALSAEKKQLRAKQVRAQIIERGQDEPSVEVLMAQLLDADERSILNGRHVLHMDDGSFVSVSDILRERATFHKATCADPLEPEYGGGRNKAVIYTDGHLPTLFSHAHGGRHYTMAYDEEDVVAALIAAQEYGEDPKRVKARLAADVLFASEGWPEIERAMGTNSFELVGLGNGSSASSQSARTSTALALTASTPVALVGAGTLDPDPIIDLLMHDFNSQFAIVAEGGSVSVMRFAYNAELERRLPVSMTVDAFRLLYGNRSVSVPRKTSTGEVEQQKLSATAVWLKHDARRTCPDGCGLDPFGRLPDTCFNLWQGFGVEEKQGDWSKLMDLIFTVLASENEEYCIYILQWLAHLVQRPHESPGVALVFRGEEGVGKGTLGRAIMRVMRPHAMQITHTKHLTGPFNAHMRTVLFLFADEAFFAGDRSNEGTLKGLITEEFRVNEAKGRDASLGRNRMHLMMASNNDWVVPASSTARRYAVFDVSPVHKQDASYFGAILDEMDTNGEASGIAAMLYDLRRIELDVALVRKAPETSGLHSQRIASLRGPQSWLFDVLTRGYLGQSTSEKWCEHYTTEELFASYQSWSQDAREMYAADRHGIGKFLASMFKPCRPRVSVVPGSALRPPSYMLGTLETARAVFAAKQGIGDAWRNGEDDGARE